MDIDLKAPLTIPAIVFDKIYLSSFSMTSGGPGEEPVIRITCIPFSSKTLERGEAIFKNFSGEASIAFAENIAPYINKILEDNINGAS